MRPGDYSKPAGFLDLDPPAVRQHRRLERELLALFERWGYEELAVPTAEYADLYEREVVGEELVHLLMVSRVAEPADFPGAGGVERRREVVLRPDFTASVARVSAARLLEQGPPRCLPLRLAYAGQVFRDVRPHGLCLKEYRQVGVELFGTDDAHAELEMLGLCAEAAAALRLRGAELWVGHVGLFRGVLRALGVPEPALAPVQRGLERAARHEAHREVLWKLCEHWRAGARARGGLEAVLAIDAAPARFFAGLEPLLAACDEDTRAAGASLRWLAERYAALWPGGPPLRLTPAASRGIGYYTGCTLSLHGPAGEAAHTELCGGGRYAELHRAIFERARRAHAARTGREAPALGAGARRLTGVGLAFGLERLAAAVGGPRPGDPTEVFVAWQRPALAEPAFDFAARLRARGLKVRCHLGGEAAGALREQLGLAAAAGTPHVVIFAPAEWEQGRVLLREMATREQRALAPEAAEAALCGAGRS